MNELPLYQIVDWNDSFENAKSRECKSPTHIYKPNKMGIGLMNILVEHDGSTVLGIWTLILDLCSRQKKPRNGYLTASGRVDGRRYRIAELAYLFRRPEKEIRRCLAVVTSPEVAWMSIQGEPDTSGAQGIREPDTSGAQGIREPDTLGAQGIRVADTLPPAGRCQVPEAVASESDMPEPPHLTPDDGYLGIPIRKERKKESLSKKEPETEESESDLIQHAEAKRLFGALSQAVFDRELRENQWSCEMEHELDEGLPLKRADWELIDWFYGLPEDHEILTITLRRQSIEALIENLGREVQKIRSVRKKLGLNGSHDKVATASNEEWTQPRRAAFERMFPGSDPGPFHLLDREMREKIDKEAVPA